ncbi:MAG: hypothetical protein ACXVJB_00130 [Mucilaginibacter sp.]
MFRKIRSNRDPRDTLLTELRREFAPHFGKAKTLLRSAADSHPKFLFWMMVINITLSAVLSFTVFRHPNNKVPEKAVVKILAPVSDGFSQAMQATQALSEMLRMKKAIDSLSGKKQLTIQDSATLEKALDRLQQLNKQFNLKGK